jgi:hypothetical protein
MSTRSTPGVPGTLKTWQHDETGRVTETAECPGPRWSEAPAGVVDTPAPEFKLVGKADFHMSAELDVCIGDELYIRRNAGVALPLEGRKG